MVYDAPLARVTPPLSVSSVFESTDVTVDIHGVSLSTTMNPTFTLVRNDAVESVRAPDVPSVVPDCCTPSPAGIWIVSLCTTGIALPT